MHYLCLHYRREASRNHIQAPIDPCTATGGALGDDDAAVVVKIKDGTLRVYDVERLNRPDRLEHYWIIQARDLNDAIRIGSRILDGTGGYLEVRPILNVPGMTHHKTGTSH